MVGQSEVTVRAGPSFRFVDKQEVIRLLPDCPSLGRDGWIRARLELELLFAKLCARSASRLIGSPLRKIVSIESYAETFVSGLSLSRSKSLLLPTSTEPSSCDRPNAVALSSVAARKQPLSGETITVSAADPLNLVGIIVPGERVCANSSKVVAFRDGIAIPPDERTNVLRMSAAG
jgi:hypothetical protein